MLPCHRFNTMVSGRGHKFQRRRVLLVPCCPVASGGRFTNFPGRTSNGIIVFANNSFCGAVSKGGDC